MIRCDFQLLCGGWRFLIAFDTDPGNPDGHTHVEACLSTHDEGTVDTDRSATNFTMENIIGETKKYVVVVLLSIRRELDITCLKNEAESATAIHH